MTSVTRPRLERLARPRRGLPSNALTVPAGTNGTNGTNDPIGPAAPTANGINGAQGPEGATGSQGPPGRIELVTCTNVKKGKKTVKQCSTKLVSGTVTFTTTVADHASLTRGRVVYATGELLGTGHGLSELILIPCAHCEPAGTHSPPAPMQAGGSSLAAHRSRSANTSPQRSP